MSKYPHIEVIITEKDAAPTTIILKICSAMSRYQIPSWERIDFMEKALACDEFNKLKNLCNSYVSLKNDSKNLVF